MPELTLDDDPLIRAVKPRNADFVFVATSFSGAVSDTEARRLVHGWGVADHDSDVQVYNRINI